ncbi:MAG: LLM class flavin-dependent oxidoreductase [Actinomycetia bacterium]|nr:LLM class flavin-dependent oxidoreductase [Actinomycetes bacterium]
MKFSLRVNNDSSPADLVKLAVAAEEAGFDQFWFSNDLFLRSAPFLAGMVASNTTRIHFGIGIMNPYSVHPSELAMLAATATEATQGRFMLGLGAGADSFLSWAGLDRAKPLATTRAAILAIKELVRGDKPADHDSHWSSEGYLRFPAETPIYLGSMSPKMTRMIGEIADGGLPLLYPPEHFAEVLELVEQGAQSAGRSMDDIDLPACFWVSVGRDEEATRRAMAEKIAYYGGAFAPHLVEKVGVDPVEMAKVSELLETHGLDTAVSHVTDQMLQLGMVGTPEQVVDRCRGLIQLGARHLSFGPPLGPDPLAAISVLGSEVLAPLRADGGL